MNSKSKETAVPTASVTIEPGTELEYVGPQVEQVMTAEELAREVQYAGGNGSPQT